MIFIVYDIQHVDEAEKKSKDGQKIICLDFLLERECQKRNIPFIPLRTLVDGEAEEESWWKLSHDISREWYRLPSMGFFKYREIRIAEAPEPIMQAYLAKIFYFARIFLFLKKAFPGETFSVPHPVSTNMSRECLSSFQPWAVLDAARMVGIVRPEEYIRIVPGEYVFEKEKIKTRLLKLYNFLMGFAPKRSRKVYLSGYWMHAESLVPFLEDTEILVLETKKFKDVPWRELFKHRMRFLYSHVPVSPSLEEHAISVGNAYMEKWKGSRKSVESYLTTIRSDLDWSPIVDACEHVINYAPRVVADIDTLFGIMEKEKPDVVLVMASVGGPHHYFFLMASIARQLGIPSVELQHATVTNDPRSVFCRVETDYLLTYGEHINEAHRKIGNGHKHLVDVGSPRFDRYVNGQEEGTRRGRELLKQLGLDTTRPILLVAVPYTETYASAVDSYQLHEFLEATAEVQRKVLGLQLVFKCRNPKSVDYTKKYIEEIFSHDFAITGEEDIFPFICASDAVVCNNSTVIYQAVISRKPLILFPWKRFDYYHAELYASHIPLFYSKKEAAEALARIFSDPLYRNELLSKQEQFLAGYMFDGKSSKRVAEFIKNLAL